MFLNLLQRRNQALLDAVITLHQAGKIPANTYALDLDTVVENAATIASESHRLGLTPFAMTKQVGRNPDFCRAVTAGGIAASVNVDLECARATARAGMEVGHLGHLVQIPRAEAQAAARLRPNYWTVFNEVKAAEAATAAQQVEHQQKFLARIRAEGDEFYSGHEGGFLAEEIERVAERLDRLEAGEFAGITTFPALLFDPQRNQVRPTHNLRTLELAAQKLRQQGRTDLQINAPGTTSTAALATLADAGATQVEPGHALTGTTPWHAAEDLPEKPAICYVSEISHTYNGRGYFFGGGLYVDPVIPEYQIRGIVGRNSENTHLANAEFPLRSAIDYYGQVDSAESMAEVGDTVVLGFRAQAFVTRAYTVGIKGISSGNPVVGEIWASDGSATDWPN